MINVGLAGGFRRPDDGDGGGATMAGITRHVGLTLKDLLGLRTKKNAVVRIDRETRYLLVYYDTPRGAVTLIIGFDEFYPLQDSDPATPPTPPPANPAEPKQEPSGGLTTTTTPKGE